MEEGTCLRDCISYLFNIPKENVENFVAYDNWLERLEVFVNSLGYKMIRHDYVNELEIPVDKYLVWGMSRRNNPHSVIHSKGHLIYDFVEIKNINDEHITDYYHKECDKWIHGVKDIYHYVWFEKI
jgi:hypothetical protein